MCRFEHWKSLPINECRHFGEFSRICLNPESRHYRETCPSTGRNPASLQFRRRDPGEPAHG